MNQLDERHVFCCPNCTQKFKSTYEQIGLEMSCPQCASIFKIPGAPRKPYAETSVDMNKTAFSGSMNRNRQNNVNRSLLDSLTYDELNLLQQLDAEIVPRLENLTRRHSWEYILLNNVLSHCIAHLKQVVAETEYVQVEQKAWKKRRVQFNLFLKAYLDQYFHLLGVMYKLMTEQFYRVIHGESINEILQFASNMEQVIQDIIAFHQRLYQEPLPRIEAYLIIQEIMAEWAPYCCQNLEKLAFELERRGPNSRDRNFFGPQISFIVPDIYKLIKIVNELGIGFERPKTVFTGFSPQ